MPLELNVTGNLDVITRDIKKIKASIPRLTQTSINALGTWARREVIKETSKELRLPVKAISQTIRNGKAVPRFTLYKARAGTPVVRLVAISAGIQVTDIAGNWIGRKPGQGGGVKAKGGRFYKGAFKAPAPGGTIRVWKRKPGSKRLPIFLPRVGVNDRMIRAFDAKVAGIPGSDEFNRLFRLATERELRKLGFR